MTVTVDPDRVPTGARIRRITASIAGARQGHGIGSVLVEVWGALTTAAVVVAVVVSGAQVLREDADARPADVVPVDGAALVPLVVLAALGAVLALAARLGPVALGSGAATWWLPMPVDRRGLLRPAVVRAPVLGVAAGLVVGVTAALVLAEPAVTTATAWAVTCAGAGGLVVALALGAQVIGRSARALAAVGDGVLAVSVTVLAVLALTGRDVPVLAVPWVAGVVLLVVTVAVTVAAERTSDRLPTTTLRSTASVGERSQAAVLSLDVRELGRTLALAGGRTRYGSRALAAGGPRRALVVAELVLLSRTPRLLVQAAVGVLLAAAASRLPMVGSGVPWWVVLGLTGFWTANAVAAGARHADLVPALDRSLPLSARAARATHGLVPLVAGVVWAAVVLGAHAVVSGEPGWAALAPAWAVVLAAGALRSSFRPVPRYRMAAVSTPMGGLPQPGSLLTGVDLVLVTTAPTALAAHLGGVPVAVVVVQALAAGGAVAWALRSEPD